MQRRSFVPTAALAAAAALTVGLAGCSGGSSATGGGDAKGGDPAALAQSGQPGRYSTLPDACRLPAEATVRSLLPGDGKRLTGEEAAQVYGGQADVTYDTDRRVGCRWKRESTAGTRHLTLDIQRVVSYDTKISDDDRARELYGERALAAGVPREGTESAPPSDAPSSSTKPTKPGKKDDKGGKDGKGGGNEARRTAGDAAGGVTVDGGSGGKGKDGKGGAPSGSPSTGTTAHTLDDLGDGGFLQDALATADSGVHRDITVVFRTSNVIVTLTYDQWSTDKTRVPESGELQDKAHALAEELADSLSE